MNLTARIDHILEINEGSNSKGKWRKQNIIVTPYYKSNSDGIYHPEAIFGSVKPVCVTLWGNLIDSELIRVGNEISIDISVSSREYNGKWYTDVIANKIELYESDKKK